MCLLDTNAAIALTAGNATLRALLDTVAEVFISVISLGEMYFGAEKSARVEYNRNQVDLIITRLPVLNCDVDTAHQFGKVKQRLKIKGRPIPENDIWIAAIALQYDLILITHDEHFKQVDGLQPETW